MIELKKKKKPEELEPPEEPEEDDEPELSEQVLASKLNANANAKHLLQLGDILISTNRGSLSDCVGIAKNILKSPSLKRYLGDYKIKKIFNPSTALG